jgi:exportin-5
MRLFVLSNPTILEPLILFCTHALRMRDSRSCVVIARVIRSILPHFSAADPIFASVREFIATEVLKACITSVHEPYFVDLQKDLAQVIATIWVLYGDKTPTPRNVILSLPGITEEKVERAWGKMIRASSGRQQRAIILDLLEGLRGVSISEQGKIDRRDPRKVRSEMQARFMKVDEEVEVKEEGKDEGPDLGGVADMFG